MDNFVTLDSKSIDINDLREVVANEVSKANSYLDLIVPTSQKYKKKLKFMFFSFNTVDSDKWKSDHKSEYTYAIYCDDRIYGVGLNERGRCLLELSRILSVDGEYNVSSEVAELIYELLNQVEN